jgi:hypothetical protein
MRLSSWTRPRRDRREHLAKLTLKMKNKRWSTYERNLNSKYTLIMPYSKLVTLSEACRRCGGTGMDQHQIRQSIRQYKHQIRQSIRQCHILINKLAENSYSYYYYCCSQLTGRMWRSCSCQGAWRPTPALSRSSPASHKTRLLSFKKFAWKIGSEKISKTSLENTFSFIKPLFPFLRILWHEIKYFYI